LDFPEDDVTKTPDKIFTTQLCNLFIAHQLDIIFKTFSSKTFLVMLMEEESFFLSALGQTS